MKNRIPFSRKLVALTLMSGLSAALSPISAALAAPPSTIRVSVSSTGEEGNHYSNVPAFSANGRFVAFASGSSNLVEGDNNGWDVFVRDLKTGVTQLVSLDSSGVQANALSGYYDTPAISADGRFVAFESEANNLVTGDNNGTEDRFNGRDIFVRDLKTGVTQRVSVDSSGIQSNGRSESPTISANGRFVAFHSFASNLVAGDNNGWDVFVRDLKTGVTQRVSVDSAGVESNGDSSYPSISANGRFIVFHSIASNLVAGDNNGTEDSFNGQDIFVRDLKTGVTQRVSVDSAGAEANSASYYPSISANGRFVAFHSFASNLVAGDNNEAGDIFVRDLKTGVTQRVSINSTGGEANNGSGDPSISANGRFVAFPSDASNLVAGDNNGRTDVFVHDLKTGRTQRVSVDSAGVEGNDFSLGSALSYNGRYVGFMSYASNLVPDDNNGTPDSFVRRLW